MSTYGNAAQDDTRERTLVGYAPADVPVGASVETPVGHPAPGYVEDPRVKSGQISGEISSEISPPDSADLSEARQLEAGPAQENLAQAYDHERDDEQVSLQAWSDRRNPRSRRDPINRGRHLSRKFFEEGERQQQSGWENSPLAEAADGERDPAISFESFDKVPSRRGPLLAFSVVAVLIAGGVIAWGIGHSWSSSSPREPAGVWSALQQKGAGLVLTPPPAAPTTVTAPVTAPAPASTIFPAATVPAEAAPVATPEATPPATGAFVPAGTKEVARAGAPATAPPSRPVSHARVSAPAPAKHPVARRPGPPAPAIRAKTVQLRPTSPSRLLPKQPGTLRPAPPVTSATSVEPALQTVGVGILEAPPRVIVPTPELVPPETVEPGAGESAPAAGPPPPQIEARDPVAAPAPVSPPAAAAPVPAPSPAVPPENTVAPERAPWPTR